MVRTIEVTSATELSSAQIKKIEKVFLSKHKGENVEFVYKIDKELIGGILVVDGDKYYDGTVRSQIDKINTDFKMSEVYVQAATVPKRRKSKPSADSASVKKTPAAAPEQLNAENIKAQTEKDLSDIVSRYN